MPDRKVVKRLITYDGPVDWIEKTLSKSLAEGRNVIGSGRTITISTITIADSEECTRNPLDMRAMKKNQYLSVSDTAKQLHCTTKYVYDMLHSGSLPATKADGHWQVPVSAIAAKLAKRAAK